MTNPIRYFLVPLSIIVTVCSGCKKFVEVPLPQNQVVSGSAFSDDPTAIATLNGIYGQMASAGGYDNLAASGVTLYTGLSSDELYYFSAGTKDEFRSNQLSSMNADLGVYFWTPAYNIIYGANACIEGASNSTLLSPAVKNQVIGESLVLRSFIYFQLVNLFGPVPLITTTEYEKNQNLPRNDTTVVWKQIQADLEKATTLLPLAYPSAGRARPNKAAAEALLAKTCLYRKQWNNARRWADSVESSGVYSLIEDLNQVFLMTSQEAIWQLTATNSTGYNTADGFKILPASTSSTPLYLVTNELSESFESNDKRKASWLASSNYRGQMVTYPFKYKLRISKPATEAQTMLRFAEVLLIRAEARAQLGDLAGSINDVNKIRVRAGLSPVHDLSFDELYALIQQERRFELFSEWGNRWFDLKRTGTASKVLSPIEGKSWQPIDELWPVPQTEILINPNLKQNEGY